MPAKALGAALVLLALSAPAAAQTTQEDAPVTEGQPKFTPPVLVKRVPAVYPKEAVDLGLQGTVVLEFDVDEQGKVGNVTIKQPAGHGFDEAAAQAVRQFVFTPAMNDRTPVPSHITYAYKFVLKQVTRPKPAPRPTDEVVRIRGGVFLRGTRAPVAAGKVIALPADKQADHPSSSDIDDAGHFALKGLPPGKWHLIINGPKAKRYERDETLAPNEVLTVNYFIEPSQYTRYESTVKTDLNREEISRQTLTTEELVKLPGSFGDALRAIENLPGVARAPFNSGLIIVRGGKPTDSKVYLGTSEVPQLYHFGALRSVVPTEVVDKVDYFPGNFGARYGRAIAGTIDVDLREGKRDRWHGAAETNAFDTGLLAEGPVGKGSVILAARRSYIDALLAAVNVPGLRFTSAPVYYDYQGILDYPVADGKLKLMLLGSDDQLKLIFNQPASADPAFTAFGTHIFFHKLQLRYTRPLGNGWSLWMQVAGGFQGQQGALGTNLRYDIQIGNVDSRFEARWQYSRTLKLLFGTDWNYSNVALNLDVPQPPHEGQIPSPISALDIQHNHAVQNYFILGLYAEANWKPNARWTITPGLRLDFYSPLQHPSFDPRLSARLQVWKYTWLKAGIGLYSQAPQSIEYDRVFGNPALRPEKALHTALTLEQGIAPGAIAEVTGFYKHLWDLSSVTSEFVQRDGTTQAEHYASIGEGRIYGMEVLLRQSVSKWFFGWISYTLLKSERKDCPTCNFRLFDFDQTHILVIALHAYLPKGWEVGARFRYITGFPYTPPYGGYYNADTDVYGPAMGPVNTARIAPYHALDLRVDKTFLFKRWLLRVYLDVTNVYDRANPESTGPNYDFTRNSIVTGLPIIPSFGIRGEF